MQKMKKSQQMPKWFDGALHSEGAEVTNPFSGESYELNAVELSIYDFIIGCQFMFENQPIHFKQSHVNLFHKALNWFRINNPEAYYVLLD